MMSLFGTETGVCPNCGESCRVEPASYNLTAYTCDHCHSFGVYKPIEAQGEPIAAGEGYSTQAGAEGTKRALNAARARQQSPGSKAKQGVLCQPGRRFVAVVISEEAVQAQSIRALVRAGYLVEQTTVRFKRQRCPECNAVHQYKPVDGSGYGSTRGLADLLARNPGWPPGLWIQLEQKGTKTVLSEDQKRQAAAGGIFICRSAEDSLNAVRSIDALFAQFAAMQA